MTRTVWYRCAAVLMVVFAAAHTFGFRQVDPAWGVGSLVAQMQSLHFDLVGSNRTYWQTYTGFGFFFTVFMLFAGALAWQLGNLSAQAFAPLRGIAWTFAVCFAAIAIVAWRYTFIIPTAFSVAILLCLVLAARLARVQA